MIKYSFDDISFDDLLNKYKKYKPLIDYSEFDMFHTLEPIYFSKDYLNCNRPNYPYYYFSPI
jgi:hypothetical protein